MAKLHGDAWRASEASEPPSLCRLPAATLSHGEATWRCVASERSERASFSLPSSCRHFEPWRSYMAMRGERAKRASILLSAVFLPPL